MGNHGDLVDLNSLSQRVIQDHIFLSSRHLPRVKKLLRQLASQVLPVYRVCARDAVLQESVDRRLDMESKWACTLPHGALVLAKDKVKHDDCWWICIWTGEWLQVASLLGEATAELYEPSRNEVQSWLQQAAKTRRSLLIDNAAMVARQFEINPEEVV